MEKTRNSSGKGQDFCLITKKGSMRLRAQLARTDRINNSYYIDQLNEEASDGARITRVARKAQELSEERQDGISRLMIIIRHA